MEVNRYTAPTVNGSISVICLSKCLSKPEDTDYEMEWISATVSVSSFPSVRLLGLSYSDFSVFVVYFFILCYY